MGQHQWVYYGRHGLSVDHFCNFSCLSSIIRQHHRLGGTLCHSTSRTALRTSGLPLKSQHRKRKFGSKGRPPAPYILYHNMRLSEWKKLHPRESSNVRTTAWRHRRQSPKTSLRHAGDNRNRLNQLRPLRDRIRKAWCASEALQLKWTAKYDELLAKRTGVPEVGPSKKKVPLQAADTQWQAGNASTPFRAELLAKTVQQYHPGQPVEMRKLCLGPFAAAQAVRSKDLDSLFVSDPDTDAKTKLPQLAVRVQC